KEFEEAWGVKVLDRYSVVLHIFRRETLLEFQQRLLKEREGKIRRALEGLRRKRKLLRSARTHKDLPVVSLVPVSALTEQGLDRLKVVLEEEVVRSTGKLVLNLTVDLSSPQLSWLYREATVQEVTVDGDEGSAVAMVIIGTAAYGRYRKTFPAAP
ncbi:hypothetical protein CRUP_009037, partial [Coryphaenoides rupestris]